MHGMPARRFAALFVPDDVKDPGRVRTRQTLYVTIGTVNVKQGSTGRQLSAIENYPGR